MTKLPCDIVKDLLPLYEDDVCSGESKDSVEEHLSICENCRNEYLTMHEKLPPISDAETSYLKDDIAFIKKTAKKLTFRQIIYSGIVLFVVCLLFISVLSASPSSPIPLEETQVTELYQLKNGDIYCTLETDKEINRVSLTPIIVPEENFTENYVQGQTEITLRSNIFNKISSAGTIGASRKVTFVLSLKSESSHEGKHVIHKSNAIFIVGKSNKRQLIWKEGDPLKKAPQNIEDWTSKKQEEELSNQDSDSHNANNNIVYFGTF